MTFSPQLEAKFADLITHYPEGRQKGALIPMLLYAQDEVGAVTPEVIAEVASRLNVKPVEVEEVIGYYTMLWRHKRGKHHIQVCTNLSCMLAGGEELYAQVSKKLGIGHRETTPDGQFSLEETECLGACSWAPAVLVNYDFHMKMTPEKLDRLIESLGSKQ
ncbi:MAG: NAD(P)H-dependent oxidoreductase subunit E [Bryobacteraceae bacterium]|jgi:NADH-quinone oxidoreductase subunit E|nr:NAD(P)H-dependent oxidoreductase subunit E [Bryobacteraceae bacterium]